MENKRRYSPHKEYAKYPRPKIFFRILKFFVKLFYKKPTVEYEVELSHDKPIVYVGNHCQIHGPLMSYLHFKEGARIWCTNEVLFWKTAPNYVYNDLLGAQNVSKNKRWIYKILSYILTPICVTVFRGADTIPVYRDARLVTTYNKSAETIKEGKDIVILPECPDALNEFINVFNPGFVDIARFMRIKTKKEIVFVPMYISPDLKRIKVGKPVEYDFSRHINEQREELLEKLQDEVTRLAKTLPPHKPVYFMNR